MIVVVIVIVIVTAIVIVINWPPPEGSRQRAQVSEYIISLCFQDQ